MKFRCGHCGAKYRSDQEFTSERTLNFQCKKCGTRLLLHKKLVKDGDYFVAEVTRSKSQSETVIAERPTDLDLTPSEKPPAPTQATPSAVEPTAPSPSPITVMASIPSAKTDTAPVKRRPEKEPLIQVPETEEARLQRIRSKIVEQATRFEILPLIRVLKSVGYPFEDILWRSSRNTASMSAVIESVEFLPKSSGYVRVCLSRGLLGADGLLPSYFLRMVEKMPDPEPFYDFIHFFDHSLLREYVRALYPQLNSAVMGDWSKLKKSYLGMLGVSSESTLTWLFQLYFPELVVQVKREALAVTTDSYAFRTGQSMLDGTGVIGNEYASDASGFTVQMIAPEERNDTGQIWPHIVRKRLNSYVRPVLGQYRLNLNLNLLVSEHATWAGIQDSGFLGYDRIRGNTNSGLKVSVHSGPFLSAE